MPFLFPLMSVFIKVKSVSFMQVYYNVWFLSIDRWSVNLNVKHFSFWHTRVWAFCLVTSASPLFMSIKVYFLEDWNMFKMRMQYLAHFLWYFGLSLLFLCWNMLFSCWVQMITGKVRIIIMWVSIPRPPPLSKIFPLIRRVNVVVLSIQLVQGELLLCIHTFAEMQNFACFLIIKHLMRSYLHIANLVTQIEIYHHHLWKDSLKNIRTQKLFCLFLFYLVLAW